MRDWDECQRIIEALAWNYDWVARRIRSIDHEDLIQIGEEAYLLAIVAFDPTRGMQFKNYVFFRVRNAMVDEVHRQMRYRVEVPFSEEDEDGEPVECKETVYEEQGFKKVDDKDEMEHLIKLADLKENELKLVRYCLAGVSQVLASAEEGMSTVWANILMQKAKEKMRGVRTET